MYSCTLPHGEPVPPWAEDDLGPWLSAGVMRGSAMFWPLGPLMVVGAVQHGEHLVVLGGGVALGEVHGAAYVGVVARVEYVDGRVVVDVGEVVLTGAVRCRAGSTPRTLSELVVAGWRL